jgi:hypothetical protein
MRKDTGAFGLILGGIVAVAPRGWKFRGGRFGGQKNRKRPTPQPPG